MVFFKDLWKVRRQGKPWESTEKPRCPSAPVAYATEAAPFDLLEMGRYGTDEIIFRWRKRGTSEYSRVRVNADGSVTLLGDAWDTRTQRLQALLEEVGLATTPFEDSTGLLIWKAFEGVDEGGGLLSVFYDYQPMKAVLNKLRTAGLVR